MSATTALGAAPLLAAGEETAAANLMPRSGEEVRSHAERGNEERQEEEQKVAKDAKEEVAAEAEANDTVEVSEEDTVIAPEAVAEEVPPSGEDLRPHVEHANEQARQAAAERVRQSAVLPPGLRERLAVLVESGGQVGGEGQALVSIDEAIRAVAESLPSALRIGGGEVARPEHPSGESFFSGRTAEEITDQQAEELARGQLARSGLLRGQRVRVAD